ncbi:hypothetical protein B0H11DRAFT_2248000 [Mycena galericulata]|nr:hypothetical protein B0H11DRAFT_2248000 [Mycena galericulata]
MLSLLPGSLSKADETVVRKLLKVVRATKYEDPVDQDDFLTDSANTVLNYRSRIDSFAVVAELGECVFTIRSMMHANGVRLGKPPSATFISLQDFAGEIVRKRQLFQERQRANAERAKVVEGMAARIARNEALEYASKQNDKPPISPDADAISIPSSSDDSAGDTQHAVEKCTTSPVQSEPAAIPRISQVRLATPLSPLNELGVHFGRLSLFTPLHAPPNSPLSSSPSLPGLVPDFYLGQHRLPSKGSGWKKGRAKMVGRPSRVPMHDQVVQCNSFQMVPRPFGPPLPPPKSSFVDDWLRSKPKFVGSSRHRKNFAGKSKPFVNPNRLNRQSSHKLKTNKKCCYYCSAPDHLVALCPLRESIN